MSIPAISLPKRPKEKGHHEIQQDAGPREKVEYIRVMEKKLIIKIADRQIIVHPILGWYQDALTEQKKKTLAEEEAEESGARGAYEQILVCL